MREEKKQPVKKTTKKLSEKTAKRSDNSGIVTITIKFHEDKSGGHNHIVVDDIEENHVSVGLTSKKKKGKNHPNYELTISPLKNGKTSYVRRQGTVAPKNSYSSPKKGKITEEDFGQVKKYGEKAKQKYIAQKGKKK